MSWSIVGAPVTRRVTHKLAGEFAALESPPNDRQLSERRLQVYEKAARDGLFRPVSWAKAYCTETDETYRVNGKHTSTLFSAMEPLPELYAVIEEFRCETFADVVNLYATYDSKTQTRTTNDIYRLFAASVPELSDIPSKVVNATISGLSYYTWLEHYSAKQAAERAELLLDEPEFAIFVHSVLGKTDTCRHLIRVPVVAAMYGSWKKSQAKAREFWTSVRDETGAKPMLPDRKLAKWLSINSVRSGRGASADRPQSRQAPQREFYVRCIHAWNAWRKDESTDLKYFKGAKIPAFA
jgi:hypothetical protein